MAYFSVEIMHESTNIQKGKHFQFLKTVLWLGLTAFGGPQMHLPLFKKRLIERKPFITHDDLIEITAFCNLLPGPTTTQTITTIGLKLGGPRLAIFTVLFWALPGASLLLILALSPKFLSAHQLQYIPATVVGFMVYGFLSMSQWMEKTPLNWGILIFSGILGFAIHSPLIFPIGVVLAAILSARFSKRHGPKTILPRSQIKWKNLTVFFIIFTIVGAGGLLLSKYKTQSKWLQPVVYFENTYRMGALSFGGGNVLAAMTMEQYVHHKKRLTLDELNTGIGAIQASPGPNFNLAVYTNAIAMRNAGYEEPGQILGGIIGLIAVFLPGILLVLFAYPIWTILQNYSALQRSIPGIFAVSVGFILSASLILGEQLILNIQNLQSVKISTHLFVLLGTVLMLFSNKISTPLVVLFSILIGWLLP